MTQPLQTGANASQPESADPAAHYRVMVVDDSSAVRGLITRAIEGHPMIRVVAAAADGATAIRTLERSPADVVILDVNMPVMDGLTALPRLLAVDPGVKIIVASTLSLQNAEISIDAMKLGAADYIPKPTSTRALTTAREFKDELTEKILALGAAARKSGVRQSPTPASAPATRRPVAAQTEAVPPRRPQPTAQIELRPMPTRTPDILLIASSTGGPQALFRMIGDLGKINQPVMITQHMPPAFTTILADHISKQCSVSCVEAKDGMVLEGGVCYLAPGDYHMLVQDRGGRHTIVLNQEAHENYCRPAADPMIRSAVAAFGKKVLVVVLTGMGQDGWRGSEMVVQTGGAVIAQDEATSVVWGMPAAVAQAGLCSAVLPINEIGACVRRIARGGVG